MIVPIAKCSLTVLISTPQTSSMLTLGMTYPISLNIPVTSGTLPPMYV